MSKQLLLMVALTALGTVGVYVFNPIFGVLVYYIYSILRPQFFWEWVLPRGVAWSYYVGMATLGAAALAAVGLLPDQRPPSPQRPLFGRGHYFAFIFGIWIAITTYFAMNQAVAEQWFMEYLKIALMFAASAVLIKTIQEVRLLLVWAVIVLSYLAIEINIDYLQTGILKIYTHGHGGMDNNGAGLQIAMSIPLMYFAFEALTNKWRWLLLVPIPFAVHAVEMTFSRGAMLSLLVGLPLLVLRSPHKRWLTLALVTLGPPLIVVTAGPEIQKRFFSIETAHEMDASAKSRLMSWNAAIQIANKNPIFGVGVRNANLLSHEYGADMEGRTIHSQYLQLAADNGWVGMGIYILLLLVVWNELRFLRWETSRKDDPESRLYYNFAAGIECSMAIFCFGALFLSLEVFELPFFLMLCGVQMSLLYRHRHGPVYDPLKYALVQPLPVGTAGRR